jgi:hypothetical protein
MKIVVERKHIDVENKGAYCGRIYNEETGEDIPGVCSAEIKMSHDDIPHLHLTLNNFRVEIDRTFD